MDNGSKYGLTLHRMPQGGFLVVDAPSPFFRSDYDCGRMMEFHFASTSIDEALKFIKDKVKPIPPEQQPAKKAR